MCDSYFFFIFSETFLMTLIFYNEYFFLSSVRDIILNVVVKRKIEIKIPCLWKCNSKWSAKYQSSNQIQSNIFITYFDTSNIFIKWNFCRKSHFSPNYIKSNFRIRIFFFQKSFFICSEKASNLHVIIFTL